MQRRTLSVLAALAAALPLASQAGTMDYTFVELGYVDAEVDDFDVDGDGFELRGSVAFHPNFFAFAEYQDLGLDGGADVTTMQVGVGGRYALNDKLDLVGRLGVVRADLEWRRFNLAEDEDGSTIGAYLRGEV